MTLAEAPIFSGSLLRENMDLTILKGIIRAKRAESSNNLQALFKIYYLETHSGKLIKLAGSSENYRRYNRFLNRNVRVYGSFLYEIENYKAFNPIKIFPNDAFKIELVATKDQNRLTNTMINAYTPQQECMAA